MLPPKVRLCAPVRTGPRGINPIRLSPGATAQPVMKGKLGFLERIRVSMIRHLHLPELVEMLFYLLVRDGRKEGQGLDKLSPNG